MKEKVEKVEKEKVFAYRNKNRSDIYLVRQVNDNDEPSFNITKNPSLAVYAYSLDKENYDMYVNDFPEESVVFTDNKEFVIDGYSGELFKEVEVKLGEFEKVEFRER